LDLYPAARRRGIDSGIAEPGVLLLSGEDRGKRETAVGLAFPPLLRKDGAPKQIRNREVPPMSQKRDMGTQI
jgi:hypothetical protein